MKQARDREALAARYAAVQDVVLQEAQSRFVARELQDVRCIVRLVVEFEDYLKREEINNLDLGELEYVAESIFAGTRSFANLAHGYKVLVGATHSAIDWTVVDTLISPNAFRTKYLGMYEEFEALDVKASFEAKLGLALDLFKLQLLFVGILYTW